MVTSPSNEGAADALAQAKPAFLRRVRIRGYKSIAFCDVTLEPLTVLVGRNGAGKSNFLDALAFVGELAHRDIRDAIDDRGGPDGLLNIEAIAGNYWHLHRQQRSAWTQEIDLRPWVERF